MAGRVSGSPARQALGTVGFLAAVCSAFAAAMPSAGESPAESIEAAAIPRHRGEHPDCSPCAAQRQYMADYPGLPLDAALVACGDGIE